MRVKNCWLAFGPHPNTTGRATRGHFSQFALGQQGNTVFSVGQVVNTACWMLTSLRPSMRRGRQLKSLLPTESKDMKVTVEVTQADLAEMSVSVEQLEDAVKQEVEGGLDVDGETLYINDTDVTVVVVN